MNKKAKPVSDYLKSLEDFENRFPGYEREIHGVEKIKKDGKIRFRIMCIKEESARV